MRHIFFIITLIFFISGCSFYQNLNYIPSYNTNTVARLKVIANEWKKTSYVLGGTSKTGADCSGFTQIALAQLKIRITRTTQTQLGSGRKVSKSKL
ncbi:C40 family peptidase, partial [Campylobacter coli]|uniref:C40 family peptidase n=1 Tax=Campylobacter coli TaxID=195 RepID=UPI003819E3C1